MANSDLGAYRKSDIQYIADSIRYKNGSDQLYKVEEMGEAIRNLVGDYYPITRHNDGWTYYYISLTDDDLHVKVTCYARDYNYKNSSAGIDKWAKSGIDVDWGDGSTTDRYYREQVSASYNAIGGTHIYLLPGDYIVKVRPAFWNRDEYDINMWTYYSGEFPVKVGANASTAGNRAIQKDNSYYGLSDNSGDIITKAIELSMPTSIKAFHSFYGLTNVIVNGGATNPLSTGGHVDNIGTYTFAYDYRIRNIEFYNPESIAVSTSNTWLRCDSIENLDLSGLLIPSLEGSALDSLYLLKNLTLSENTISIAGTSSLKYLTSIKKIILPSNIATVGTKFEGCYNLVNLTILNTVPPTFSGFHESVPTSCKIYVPATCGDTYKADSSWSAYASRIYELEE